MSKLVLAVYDEKSLREKIRLKSFRPEGFRDFPNPAATIQRGEFSNAGRDSIGAPGRPSALSNKPSYRSRQALD
jgi:hypothetical protein